jgi:phosphate transport system substrate-binding protein
LPAVGGLYILQRSLLAGLILLGLLAVSACGGGSSGGTTSSSSGGSSSGGGGAVAACATGTATASGSTALLPLVQKAAALYQAKCPGSTITVSGGGSSTGLANVASGTSDIGDSDVPASDARNIDASALTDHQVAIVMFAVVVNPATHVTNLSLTQVQSILSGKVTNWSSVGGANLPVTLIERKPGSGTRLTFDKTIMKGIPESATPASTQDSTQLVVQGVAAAAGGVSYVSAASVNASAVPVSLDGVKPDASTVKAGTYPFFSHEHMYTKGSGSALARSFIADILSSTFQDQQVSTLGFLPVATTTRQSLADV